MVAETQELLLLMGCQLLKSYLDVDFRDEFVWFPDDEERLLAQDDRSSPDQSRSESTPSFVR